jgi:hypothetical protein
MIVEVAQVVQNQEQPFPLGDRPDGEGQAALGRTEQGYIDQLPKLFGAQNGRPSLGVRHLLETAAIETMDPVVRDREITAAAIGGLLQTESSGPVT